MAGNEIAQIQDSLADRFCARRDLYCLFRFLPAYFAPNGLTDGWEERRTALGDTRASRMLAQHYPFPFDSGRRLSEVTWQRASASVSAAKSGQSLGSLLFCRWIAQEVQDSRIPSSYIRMPYTEAVATKTSPGRRAARCTTRTGQAGRGVRSRPRRRNPACGRGPHSRSL
jgi:hypothetical protein